MLATLRGDRPGKPPGAESLGFSNELWGLVQLCWNELPSNRPTAQQLLDCISPSSLSWNPPQTYPVIETDFEDIIESDSSESLGMSLPSSVSEAVPGVGTAREGRLF